MSGPHPPTMTAVQAADNDEGHTLFFRYSEFNDEHFEYPQRMYKGYALIINNEEFTYDPVCAHNRQGSSYDSEGFREALISLGFLPHLIRTESNKTVKQTRRILQEVAKKDFTDFGCLIVAVFSFGEDFKIFGTDGPIAYNELINPFGHKTAPSLFDKPKLFIVQSESPKSSSGNTHDAVPPVLASRVITEPDVLFMYSHDYDDISWKSRRQGTWFVQSLIEVLRLDGRRLDMMSILTRVNYLVRQCYESYVQDAVSEPKCPNIHSLLSKTFKLY